MSMIIKTKEVHNGYGDLIKLVYHYEDGSTVQREVFVSVKELEKMEHVKKRWLGENN